MESTPISQYAFILLLFANSALSVTDNFFFNGFQQASNLILDGGARITSNGVLQLTNDTQKLIAHAFFSSPFHMLEKRRVQSFSTTFVFDIITNGSDGGHGFTFALSPSKTLPDSDCCNYLGLLSKSNNGNFSNHVFAVEFDTEQGFALVDDIDDNHVGIDINSLVSNVSRPASYYTNNTNNVTVQLQSGSPIQAWIDYDGVDKVISVTISPISVARPRKPLILEAIDLSPILKDSTYVGFTSSTGKLASSHYILGWSFKINGVAHALDVSQLPLPPQAEGNSQGKKAAGLKIGALSSAGTLLLVVLVLVVRMYLHQRSKLAETLEDWERDYPHRFTYKVLYKATKGFKELIGSGGFGEVYKGLIPESGEVAIKRISNSSKQGVKEFVAEIASLGRLRHKNLVQLKGWCKRNQDLILIYEYMPNGSLDAYLFENARHKLLSWSQRFKIIKDIASGLLYLHEEWEQVVIHRDIKASNVLLDGDMNGKLGDFGLARLYEHGANPHSTHVVGTVGYLAPELSRTGKATASTDVFSYGALLLEVVCGRRPIKPNAPTREILLLDWVRQCWTNGRDQLVEVVDPKLGDSYSREEVELVLKLGLRCSQSNPEMRPTMREVTQYLNGHHILEDDDALVFSEADAWELATRSYPSSSGMLSTSPPI